MNNGADFTSFRVWAVAPTAIGFEGPCPCGGSHETPAIVWEGSDPSQYKGGLGAFDEGCHHPSRWMEGRSPTGEWLPVDPVLDGVPGRKKWLLV